MLPGPPRHVTRRVRTALGSTTRPVLIRITEEALDRYPDRTVALVRASLERSARRDAEQGLVPNALLGRLTVRAMDVHPVVAQGLVRWWLKRAAG